MIKVSQDRQPGLGTTGIVGALTLTKTGTTARTATFPDAAITVAGQNINNAFSAAQTINSPGTVGLDIVKAGTIGLRINSTTVIGSAQIVFANNSAQVAAVDVTSENLSFVGSTTAGKFLNFNIGPAFNNRLAIAGDTGQAVFSGAGVTVPNGSAAAPGIRLTSEAHGLYRVSATSLGFAVAGTAAASLTSTGAFAATTLTAAGLITGQRTDSGTTNQLDALYLRRDSSGTPTAGFGSVILTHLKSSTTVAMSASAIVTQWADATHASRRSRLTLSVYDAANVREGIRIESDGSLAVVSIISTTDASAIGTAAIVGLGGASIAKSLWVGGTAGNYINIANSTGELRVNGTKVVTAQGAAVADATGAGDVVAQLNALLARCRAHGLIAT